MRYFDSGISGMCSDRKSASANSRSNGTSVGTADVDSTSQIQVLSSNYPAEYGRTSGGLIRLVPKSGSTNFHGSSRGAFL